MKEKKCKYHIHFKHSEEKILVMKMMERKMQRSVTTLPGDALICAGHLSIAEFTAISLQSEKFYMLGLFESFTLIFYPHPEFLPIRYMTQSKQLPSMKPVIQLQRHSRNLLLFCSCSDWPKFTLLQPPICSLSSPNWAQPFPSVLLLCLAIQMLSFSLDFGQALNLALWLNILSRFFSRYSVWDLLSFPLLVCLTLSSICFLLSASSSSWSLSHLPGIDTSICLFHNVGEHRNTGPISGCCGFSLLFVLLY